MTKEIKLLIVDDDDMVIESFEESIKTYEREKKDIQYKTYIAKNLEDAEKIIKYNYIDTAIIDIKLGNFNNEDGVKIIKNMLQHFRIPIFVVSGTPEIIENDPECKDIVRVHRRDEQNIICKLIENEIPNITNLITAQYFSRNGFLERKITEFYWKDLSKTIEYWEEVAKEKPQEIDKILSRHTLSCLNEKLYVNDNMGKFDEYCPGEMYIIPPIKRHYHTGDIIKKNKELFVILNPACDIVNIELNKPYKSKLNFYILAKIISISEIPKIKHSQNNNRYDIIKDIKKNKGGDSYHFLPMFADIFPQNSDGYVVDFQDLKIVQSGLDLTQSYNDIKTYIKARDKFIIEYERVASISSPFLKDIIARFSHYYARQGQPEFM